MNDFLPVEDCGEDTCALKPGLCMAHDYYGFFDDDDNSEPLGDYEDDDDE